MKLRVKKRDNKIAVAVMALGAFAACQSTSAHADDTATEIRLLKQRLKQLEERVAEQGRKEKQTQEKLRHAAAQPGPGPGPAPYTYPIGIGLPPVQHR
jgi:predicted aminopeptidase